MKCPTGFNDCKTCLWGRAWGCAFPDLRDRKQMGELLGMRQVKGSVK